jgi:hypothetical protein
MKNAYFVVVGVMIITGILLFLYFIKKGWLKKSDYHINK